jgi:hypothetical protein
VNKKLLSLGFKKDKSNQAGDMTLNTYLYRVGIGQGMDLFATEKWISTKNLNFVYYIDTKNEIYSSVVADIENEGFAFINQSVFNDVLFDIYWKPKQDFVIGIKSETDDNNSYTPYKTTIRLISGK